MKIAIIGVGNIGVALGRLWTQAAGNVDSLICGISRGPRQISSVSEIDVGSAPKLFRFPEQNFVRLAGEQTFSVV